MKGKFEMVEIPKSQLIQANKLLDKISNKIKDYELDTYCCNGIGEDTELMKNINKLKECITITY